jgi:hypothetical protein
MFNKKILLGALVILGFVLISGCDNTVQDVRVVPTTAAAPGNVTVAKSSGGNIIFTHGAVKDATGYAYYWREKGINRIYSIVDTSISSTFSENVYTVTYPASSTIFTSGKTYEFGVRTSGTIVPGTQSSSVVWVELVY